MNHRNPSLPGLIAPALALCLSAAASAADSPASPPLLEVESVAVTPANPSVGDLLTLRASVRNHADEPASHLSFRVTVGGEPLEVYRDRLDLVHLAPGEVTEVQLYNVDGDPRACRGCGDGPVRIEVELVAARWLTADRDEEGKATAAPVPGAAVGGLPSAATATVRLRGGGKGEKSASPSPARVALPRRGEADFTEIAKSAGIDWRHHRSVFDPKLEKIMSWMGSIHAACAVADVEGDGDQDIYFLDSVGGQPNVLYRNDGGFRFTEVAAEVGLAELNDDEGVSMDAIFADLDSDGDQDLALAAYGRNRLLLNDGGRFREARDAGFDHRGNAAAVIAFELDGDGLLDLMVGNYFDDYDLWEIPHTKILQTNFETARNGGRDLLYRNRGGGRFVEVGEEMGVDDPGWTLALGAGDLDDDGDTDVYVANDFGPDLVYRNDDGRLEDVTAEATGAPDKSAGMNVDLGDYDNDGRLDIYVTNIVNGMIRQGNMLWRNLGDMEFVDVSVPTGVWDGGWGWGAKFFDYDNDGDLDIFTVNGYVSAGPIDIFRGSGTLNRGDVSDASRWPDMRGLSLSGYEASRLFRNDRAHYTEVAAKAGISSKEDGRGVAVADFDLDGDVDLLVCNSGGSPELYRNEVGAARSWLAVELVGTESNADAIGARVTVEASGRRQVRELDGGNGYSAQSSKVLHFGLGAPDLETVDRVEVRWPSGERSVYRQLPTRRRLRIVE